MRRKYDLRNKKSFLLIVVLAVLVGIVFSLFIYKYNKASKIEYDISSGAIIQDVDRNFIKLSDDAKLKYRWNGNYYLLYQDKKVSLGKKVVVYDELTGQLKIYGDVYLIQKNGKILNCKDETVLENTTKSSFYKIADREYLLVDRVIKTSDNKASTSGYLLVELDKLGNAKLSNYSMNLKTITPTQLVTSEYTFDINNELLNFGDNDIDCKKIIGSTNKYEPPEEEEIELELEQDKENNNITSNGNGNYNPPLGNGGGSSNGVINNNQTGENSSMETIINKIKMTSIVRVIEDLTQIDIDYVIYDPYNEYISVYAELIKPGAIDQIELSKAETHIFFDNLAPNTEYKVNFIYTALDKETGKVVKNTFESLNLRTKKPEYSIEVYKLSSVSNTLTYRVYLQNGYKVNKVNVKLETFDINDNKVLINSSVSPEVGARYVTGVFDISKYYIKKDAIIKLTIDSIEDNYGKMDIGTSYSFKFGR